ncbi:MAG: hypothetical protein JWM59_3732 [Verrucomicrobiales bacterium]|nr:hypothetical protein [Verrucomicrobiales bacterium]
MIALPSQLPLLRVGRYEVAAYSQDWLEENIQCAAQAAGERNWLFTEDIAFSLLVHLRGHFAGSAITLEELTGKIRALFEKIGLGEIGQCVDLVPPALSFSLDDLAREAGEGFELRFFQLLDTRIRELAALRAPCVSLTATRQGVKRLCAAKTWNQTCRGLENEIMLFLQDRLPGNGGCRFALI